MKISDEIIRNYTCEGRLNRLPYIMVTSAYFIIMGMHAAFLTEVVRILNDAEIPASISASIPVFIPELIFMLLLLADIIFIFMFFIFFIFQTIRRLHDLNITGWTVLVLLTLLIPVINLFMFWVIIVGGLILFTVKGTDEANEYGGSRAAGGE
ncbi:MAG: DUF805 domain-containing protein [Methanosarcinales archaeon]|nr:DUF805 domain-containing protein [Methanosarcinales archaeon]